MRTLTAGRTTSASPSSSREPREEPEYLSYLVRLWQAGTTAGSPWVDGRVWRGSLESSLTSERQGFASLHELFEFLLGQTGTVVDVDEMQG